MLRVARPSFLARVCRARIARSRREDRKSTRLNSSHLVISYAVFCLKKKKQCNRKSTSDFHIADTFRAGQRVAERISEGALTSVRSSHLRELTGPQHHRWAVAC